MNKLFKELLKNIMDAKTEQEALELFYKADRLYQQDKMKYEDLEILNKLVNRLF